MLSLPHLAATWSGLKLSPSLIFRACEKNHECMSVSSANILSFPIHESIFSVDVTSPLLFPFPLLADHLSQVNARAHMHVCIHLLRGKLFYGRRFDCHKTIKYYSRIPRQVCPSLRSNSLERETSTFCVYALLLPSWLCSIALKCQLRARVSPY